MTFHVHVLIQPPDFSFWIMCIYIYYICCLGKSVLQNVVNHVLKFIDLWNFSFYYKEWNKEERESLGGRERERRGAQGRGSCIPCMSDKAAGDGNKSIVTFLYKLGQPCPVELERSWLGQQTSQHCTQNKLLIHPGKSTAGWGYF